MIASVQEAAPSAADMVDTRACHPHPLRIHGRTSLRNEDSALQLRARDGTSSVHGANSSWARLASQWAFAWEGSAIGESAIERTAGVASELAWTATSACCALATATDD